MTSNGSPTPQESLRALRRAIASWLDRHILAIILCNLLPAVGGLLLAMSVSTNGIEHLRVFIVAVVCLLVAAGLITTREIHRSREAERVASEESSAQELMTELGATLRVVYKDALQPVAERLADMQPLSKEERKAKKQSIAFQVCSSISLLLYGVPDLRVVVYLVQDPEANVLVMTPVAASRARNGIAAKPFIAGNPRGDAAFATVFRDEACFINDVDDDAQLDAAGGGAYKGTRNGYAAFISQAIFDQRGRYGMLTVDTPKKGAFADTDQHLIGLVADLMAVACASARDDSAVVTDLIVN
ncbi:GAF domain-containing protein [Rhodococcus erythropolis]|uniref:GAF domain-containing protein n=1 Tax=Rhodococcus erythropolis TaxID=1833 RepID=UPI00216A63CE|nr:GAF domain-containing protein [Rhodococcus erythropolis]MCS4254956.1 GAF domain-containing protein [Rhodococcus erythropolis]MCW2430143.1 GAF domain-containing protein [Rhodococcus erythropolis]